MKLEEEDPAAEEKAATQPAELDGAKQQAKVVAADRLLFTIVIVIVIMMTCLASNHHGTFSSCRGNHPLALLSCHPYPDPLIKMAGASSAIKNISSEHASHRALHHNCLSKAAR